MSPRGGAQTPGPGKTMGAPKKPPEERTVQKGPYRFPPEVVKILGDQKNATSFICNAVIAYDTTDEALEPIADLVELEVNIIECRCGTDYVIINDWGSCPNDCALQQNAGDIKITIPTNVLLRVTK